MTALKDGLLVAVSYAGLGLLVALPFINAVAVVVTGDWSPLEDVAIILAGAGLTAWFGAMAFPRSWLWK